MNRLLTIGRELGAAAFLVLLCVVLGMKRPEFWGIGNIKDVLVQISSIAIDGNPDTLKDTTKGVVTGSCGVFPGEMGRIAIRTIKGYLDGKKVVPLVEMPIKVVDKASVGKMLSNN